LRSIAIAIAASGALVALAVLLSGRWHVHSFAAGSGTRTVITDAWTGSIQVCSGLFNDSLTKVRTICASEVAP
jgi:hypothetical protein